MNSAFERDEKDWPLCPLMTTQAGYEDDDQFSVETLPCRAEMVVTWTGSADAQTSKPDECYMWAWSFGCINGHVLATNAGNIEDAEPFDLARVEEAWIRAKREEAP